MTPQEPHPPGARPADVSPAGGRGRWTSRPSARFLALLALISLAALVRRLVGLGDESLWYDEVATVWRASAAGPLGVLARTAQDVQAPLYDLLTWAVGWLPGGPVAGWLRLPSALAGAAAVPACALVAWRVARSEGAALCVAALVAVAPFLVRQAQEARPYALLLLLSALTLLALLRAADSDGRQGLVAFALLAPGLALMHYYGLLLALVLAALLLSGAATWGARRPRAAWALVPLALALVAWSPVALRQLTLRSMEDVYAPLGASALLDLAELAGPATSLGVRPEAAEARYGSAAAILPALRWACALAFGLLVLAGLRRGARDGERDAEAGAAAGQTPPGPASCRLPAAVFVACGLGLALGAWLAPAVAWERLASAAFKGGQALDGENRVFVETVRGLLGLEGAGLVALGLLVAWLPAWARRGRAPGRRALALAAAFVPLGALLLLEAAGIRTYAPRNLVVVLPALLALAALGWCRLAAVARRGVAALFLAGFLAGWPLAGVYSARPDWREAMRVVVEAEAHGAVVATYPPWLARCVEYHGRRPWQSVFGCWDAHDLAAWAEGKPQVMLVVGYEQMTDPSGVRALLATRYGPPVRSEVRGLNCELYATR